MSLYHFIQTVNRSTYKLDLSGVVGLLGGNNAVDALETIHLYAGRSWSGWYNYAGSVTVAKRFGQMADSRFWDTLFPGPNESPAITFKLAGTSGPEYNGSFSGTKLQTKYLGHLIAQECINLPSKRLKLFKSDGITEGRRTGSCATVTIISLPPHRHEKITRCPTNDSGTSVTNNKVTKQDHELIPLDPIRDPPLAIWAIIPSLVSILACILSVLGRDFLCASLILFGIISSGLSSIALGSAALKIRVPVPSVGSPPGDGLMLLKDGSVTVLKGEEADVNIITKGVFELDYTIGILPHPKHHLIGICCLLLMTQSMAQLLLIPLCTFFGQIVFMCSFIASGLYHLFVASYHRDDAHRRLLMRQLSARVDKWTLGTRTQMAVLVCLLLRNKDSNPPMSKLEETFSSIIPNETPVWRYWRRKMLKELANFWEWKPKTSSSSYEPCIQAAPEDQTDMGEYARFSKEDIRLLENLVDDAWCVFNRFPKWRDEGFEVEGDDRSEEKAGLLSRFCNFV